MQGTETPQVVVTHAGRDRLRVQVRNHVLFTDQPLEDGGEDTGPTPTELFIAGLGSCVAFYAERFMVRHGLTTDGLRVSCRYRWAESPHRVGEIDLEVEAPSVGEDRRAAFARVVDHCTIHTTLVRPPRVRILIAAAPVAS
jgi:putative redox protein